MNLRETMDAIQKIIDSCDGLAKEHEAKLDEVERAMQVLVRHGVEFDDRCQERSKIECLMGGRMARSGHILPRWQYDARERAHVLLDAYLETTRLQLEPPKSGT